MTTALFAVCAVLVIATDREDISDAAETVRASISHGAERHQGRSLEDSDPAFNNEHDSDLDASPAERKHAMNDLKDRSMEQLESDGDMLEQLLHEDTGRKDRQRSAKAEAKPSTDLEQLSEHELAGLSTKQTQQTQQL